MARTKAQAIADGTYRKTPRVMSTSKKPRPTRKESLRQQKFKQSIGAKSNNGIIGATKLTQLERIMDGWFKQESDACTQLYAKSTLRINELEMDNDLLRQTNRRLRRENEIFANIQNSLMADQDVFLTILGDIFRDHPMIRNTHSANPTLRQFFIFADDPQHPNYIPPEFLADEDTEVESAHSSEVDEELENFERPGQLSP